MNEGMFGRVYRAPTFSFERRDGRSFSLSRVPSRPNPEENPEEVMEVEEDPEEDSEEVVEITGVEPMVFGAPTQSATPAIFDPQLPLLGYRGDP